MNTWRFAIDSDDNAIVEMSRHLYDEDPAAMPVPEEHMRKTLSTLRIEPVRGAAMVLQLKNVIAGFAFLISFWSNELGGEVIVIDELYVRPRYRNQGYGRELLTQLASPSTLWSRPVVALELEVTPQNTRAAALYSKLGFKPVKNARLRLLRAALAA